MKKEQDKYIFYTTSKKELKKQKVLSILPIVISVFFFVLAVVLGLVGLALQGWDITKFFKLPALSLTSILALIVSIVVVGFILYRKGNKDFNGK